MGNAWTHGFSASAQGEPYSGAPPMASSLSFRLSWEHDVFISFRGEDVRRTFVSHLRKEFHRQAIETYEDDGMKPGTSIPDDLLEAIAASKVFVIVFSENYASSSWCLNELVEIERWRKERERTVIPIFYEVDPSNVRKQAGDFGKAFKKTCRGKMNEQKETWKKTLETVANIAGVDSRKWDDEAKMIEQITRDILNELNSGGSSGFDNLVGIEAHIREVDSLLSLDSNEVRTVGIFGPAGIGKSTIARVLYHQLSQSNNFQHKCLMENIRGRFEGTGFDKHSLELCLQGQFLSEMFDEKDIRIRNPGVIRQRLHHRKVLVVLDDVGNQDQLNALINNTASFAPGSRIIVTTEDEQLLTANKIKHIYKVRFPSREEALQIFCHSAFGKQSPWGGFENLASYVVELAGCLPLGLEVLGSSLRGCSDKKEWEDEVTKIRTTLHGDIMNVLRVGYDALHVKDKAIFLHVACLFHDSHVAYVKKMLNASALNVDNGLSVLAKKSLIRISCSGYIEMHRLLQQMGREIVRGNLFNEPGKRQFLLDAKEIYDVLTDNTGTEAITGIRLNMSELPCELVISNGAFEKMLNLQFLIFYKNFYDSTHRLHVPETLDFLPRQLRLLHWHAYPLKFMPPRFRPECLVELTMQESKLQKLWEGTQRLINVKKIDLSSSTYLEEIPDLSQASQLEELRLSGCKRLKIFPEISQNIERLFLDDTAVEDVPSSAESLASLVLLNMSGCKKLQRFPQVSETIEILYLGGTAIEEVPAWTGRLHQLRELDMMGCTSLENVSGISELKSLKYANFSGCLNLVSFPAKMLESVSLQYLSLSKNGYKLYSCFQSSQNFHRMLRHQKISSVSVSPQYLSGPGISSLDLSGNDFGNIPSSIKLLSKLRLLNLSNCKKLKSLPRLPKTLQYLYANGCIALKRISAFFDAAACHIDFGNCTNLDQEARELIHQTVCRHFPSKHTGYACLPEDAVPKFFTHKARGSSLCINLAQRPVSGSFRYVACVILAMERQSSDKKIFISFGEKYALKLCDPRELTLDVRCCFIGQNGERITLSKHLEPPLHAFRSEGMYGNHLFLFNDYSSITASEKIWFQFRCNSSAHWRIAECGVQLMEVSPYGENMMYPQLTRKDVGGMEERENDIDVGYETEDITVSGDSCTSMGKRGDKKIVPSRHLVLRAQGKLLDKIFGNTGSCEAELFTKDVRSTGTILKRRVLAFRRNKETILLTSKAHVVKQCFHWTYDRAHQHLRDTSRSSMEQDNAGMAGPDNNTNGTNDGPP